MRAHGRFFVLGDENESDSELFNRDREHFRGEAVSKSIEGTERPDRTWIVPLPRPRRQQWVSAGITVSYRGG